ncbi:MAG: hypothetical protein GF320_05955 [Armatimonadia bacterium]|nr:hypothetical protein [Armatimonadia bacterium]
MATEYQVLVRKSAKKAIAKLPPRSREAVLEVLQRLRHDPTPGPPHHKPLVGQLAGYERWTLGQYRIIYRVDRESSTVTVGLVGDRNQMYRRELEF